MTKSLWRILFVVLLTFCFLVFPQQTLAITDDSSEQFVIKAGPLTSSTYDTKGQRIVKPQIKHGKNLVTLNSSLNGRTTELPVGSLVFLKFPAGKYNVTVTPNKGVLEKPTGVYHLPNNNIGVFKVVGNGVAAIKVTKQNLFSDSSTMYSANNSINWGGYVRQTGGPFTHIASYWTVPTSTSCTGVDSNAAAWVGLDGYNNGDLIQTGTDSNCTSGSPTYRAWWEILPAPAQFLPSNPVYPGDVMFGEIKKNTSNWTITLKNLTQNWTFSTNQAYSGAQDSTEWIVERGTVNGNIMPLTDFGSVSFVNDLQNTVNPGHSYATDSLDMIDGTTLATPSQPNINTNGFSIGFGSIAPNPPGGWTNQGLMNWTQYYHKSVLLDDGKVFIAGGYYTTLSTNHSQLFTPGASGSGTWIGRANMINDRWLHTLNYVTVDASSGAKKVIAVGGASSISCGCILNKAELWNQSTNTWSAAANMNWRRHSHASSVLNDGRLLITGGNPDSSGILNILKATELYDPINNSWTITASMSAARQNHQQVTYTDSNGSSKVMVIGGSNASTSLLTSTEIYDPSTNTWSAGPNLNYGRTSFLAVRLNDGRILVMGGNNDSEIYDPSTNLWTTVETPFYPQDAVLLGSSAGNKVLAIGNGTSVSSNAMLFDPSTNSWSATTNMTVGRSGASLVKLNNDEVLVSGGVGSGSPPQLKASEVFTY